jgi:beta-ring hydroxylase
LINFVLLTSRAVLIPVSDSRGGVYRWTAPLVGRLSKLGPPGELAAALLTRLVVGAGAARGGPEIPQALGSINAVVGQAFFVPLYDLFLTYGGIFRLNFGPKV